MRTSTATQENTLTQILKRQEDILSDLRQIKAQIKTLGSIERFEEIARKGRNFAQTKGIQPADVLQYD